MSGTGGRPSLPEMRSRVDVWLATVGHGWRPWPLAAARGTSWRPNGVPRRSGTSGRAGGPDQPDTMEVTFPSIGTGNVMSQLLSVWDWTRIARLYTLYHENTLLWGMLYLAQNPTGAVKVAQANLGWNR
jgi:hypothetical protein